MTFIPRWYQEGAVNSLFAYFEAHKEGNPLIILPTGTGKSWLPAMFMTQVLKQWPNQKIMLLTHVQELVEQDYEKLHILWPDAPSGIYCAGLNKKQSFMPLTFGTIGSVVKKPELFGHVDLLFVDECHLISKNGTTMYQKFIKALKKVNKNLRVIGMTATPYRLGQGSLTDEGGIFTDICYDKTKIADFVRFIDEGYLAPLITKSSKNVISTQGLHVRQGEYINSEVEATIENNDLLEKIVKEIVTYKDTRKKWLVFTVSIKHAKLMSDIIKSHGIKCEAIYSGMSKAQRQSILGDFKNGDLQCIVNKDILTTGHDFPQLDLIAVVRPLLSTALWVQILGRGLRPCDGKDNCLILDYGNNTIRLGAINDPVVPKSRSKGNGKAPYKECEECLLVVHAAVRKCPDCGFVFPLDQLKKVEANADKTDVFVKSIAVAKQEWFEPEKIKYSLHKSRKSGNVSIKVSYSNTFNVFNEYLSFDKDANPYYRQKSITWWLDRCNDLIKEIPKSNETALSMIQLIQKPVEICVKIPTKKSEFPEIIKYKF